MAGVFQQLSPPSHRSKAWMQKDALDETQNVGIQPLQEYNLSRA
jgi:hypothetical protein